MSKQGEIIEVCGKKVVVRYARTQEEACASCAFCSRKECHDLDCNMRDIIGESVSMYAYFVLSEEIANKPQTGANKNEPTREQKADFLQTNDADRAAEMAARRAYPYEGGTKGDICEASIPIFCKGFKAGIAYERERMMKEAHDGMIERDCGGQVMLDVPDIWEHGEYTLLNQRKYSDMKPKERRRVKVLIVENE